MASNNSALSLLVLLCLSFFLSISGTAVDSISSTTTSSAAATDFIRSKCSVTTYPSLCVQSLAVYGPTTQSNPKQLAQTALIVSLQKAQVTKALVGKLAISRGLRPREYAALNDCKKVTSDGVDRLQKSIGEFKYINTARGEELLWHISNVQTWVSSVLTDGTTCTDGFAGKAMDGRIKSSLNAQVTNMCHVTSNALALINQLAGKY